MKFLVYNSFCIFDTEVSFVGVIQLLWNSLVGIILVHSIVMAVSWLSLEKLVMITEHWGTGRMHGRKSEYSWKNKHIWNPGWNAI